MLFRSRRLGGRGGTHQPEQWRKDEVVSCVVRMEWDRLPEHEKMPTPVFMQPPCADCGEGPGESQHEEGWGHRYKTVGNDAPWVPNRQADVQAYECAMERFTAAVKAQEAKA